MAVFEKKKYGLVITETDTAEGIFLALKDIGRAHIFKVLEFKDETIAGKFYLGAYLGLERKEIIRDKIRRSGILNSKTIFVVIGTGGGGAGLALEELKVLLEEVSTRTWINVILVMSEKSYPRSKFNTSETLRGLSEIGDNCDNLSVTLISNKYFKSKGYRGYERINEEIAKWLVTETLASLASRYDIENVIPRSEFKYSTVSLKTAALRDTLTDNKEAIEKFASEAINELWINKGDVQIGNPGIVGIWLNAEVPIKLNSAFKKAKTDVDGILKDIIDEKFSKEEGTIFDDISPEDKEVGEDEGLFDCNEESSLMEDEGYHFEGKNRNEIKVVSRAAVDREVVEDFFKKVKSFLEKIWYFAESGEEAPKRLKPYVRVANQQKEWQEKIEKWSGKVERRGEKNALEG